MSPISPDSHKVSLSSPNSDGPTGQTNRQELGPDLRGAEYELDKMEALVDRALNYLKSQGSSVNQVIDTHQVACYELAHAKAGLAMARSALEYGALGDLEAQLACVFCADAICDARSRVLFSENIWGLRFDDFGGESEFLTYWRSPEVVARFAQTPGERHLDSDFELAAETFRKFAENEIVPHAEHVHRTNGDVPESVISGLAEIGGFGLSVPESFGGFAQGGDGDYLAMVVATEELSRASLGIGGSLITRPEILTRALVKGGTQAQKETWLPRLASAEILCAVAVTEPDYGSDVAGITTTATPCGDPPSGYLIRGVKTWCTFAARADVLMLLARSDPDRSKGHRGLSMFIVNKPVGPGKGFEFTQNPGEDQRPADLPPGHIQGRPIDTIGYRGMHSYEISLDDWWVPANQLIGESDGLGRGFYLQMEGFENGRLQTAARAVGVMQAAYEAALDYARARKVFGSPIVDYELTQQKLGRMAVIIQAARQFSYQVARLMAKGEGAMEASMVKAYVCRACEWVTREALQIHGGMGFAEEFPISRYFVDARVLSIFEGADETLALKVIARRLLELA